MYIYFADVERTFEEALRTSNNCSFLILGGQKLGYGNREPWKTTLEVHGTTHPSRRRKRKLESDDSGRAPDTTKKLLKEARISNDQNKVKLEQRFQVNKANITNNNREVPKAKHSKSFVPKAKTSTFLKPLEFMKAELYANDIRLFRDLSLQGYPHNGSSSCYFDSCLEALYFCSLHLGRQFDVNASVSPEMSLLRDHMIERTSIYESAQTIPEIQQRLYDIRDQLASDLNLDLMNHNNPMVYPIIC